MKNLIDNHSIEVINNIKIGKQRPLVKHFVRDFGINPKKTNNTTKVKELSKKVLESISNSDLLESQTDKMHRKLSSNIAKIIDELIFNDYAKF